MTAEREFAGFVLPFATGIFLATGPALIRMTYFPAFGSIALMVTAVLLAFMLHPYRLHARAWVSWASVAAAGLSAGAFMGASSMIMEVSSYSGIGGWAAGVGTRLGDFIDSIPFGNPGTNALLKALITGERNDISRTVADAFRDSGAAHILSLSGFHIGIIYAIVRWSLSWTGNDPRVSRLRSVLIVLICGFYTLATGAGPSIVRSFLFILLGETARILNRSRATSTLLLSSLLIQLVLSPSSIRSVSFQLSYAAMAGIAFIYPRLRDFWPGDPSADRLFTRGLRRIWDSAALSIACQLTTGPLAYIYFESFPMHFLLTNLIALPLTTLLIPVGLAAILLSYSGICPEFLLQTTDLLSSALTSSLEIISTM